MSAFADSWNENKMTKGEMCVFHRANLVRDNSRLNKILDDLRSKYKNGRVETNIYFDEKRCRLKVKYRGKWLGYFFTIEGARKALAEAKEANPIEKKTTGGKRKVNGSMKAVERNIYYQVSHARYRVKYKGKWAGCSKTVEGAREILAKAKLDHGKQLNEEIRRVRNA